MLMDSRRPRRAGMRAKSLSPRAAAIAMLLLLLPSLLLLLLLQLLLLLLLLLLNHLLLLPCCCCERVELPVHGVGGVWAHHTHDARRIGSAHPSTRLASCFFCFVLRALASFFVCLSFGRGA